MRKGQRKCRPANNGHVLKGLDEIARYLAVSHRTVSRWVRSGKLPAMHLPTGQLMTTCSLIDQMVLAHHETELADRNARS